MIFRTEKVKSLNGGRPCFGDGTKTDVGNLFLDLTVGHSLFTQMKDSGFDLITDEIVSTIFLT